MRWIAITLQVGLGLLFLFSAGSKLAGGVEDIREHLAIAPWFWTLTALVEAIGAAGLLAGLKYPRLAGLAGLWLAATMAGAVLAHLWAGDGPTEALSAALLLVLTLAVSALRWPAARIDARLAARPGAATPKVRPSADGRCI